MHFNKLKRMRKTFEEKWFFNFLFLVTSTFLKNISKQVVHTLAWKVCNFNLSEIVKNKFIVKDINNIKVQVFPKEIFLQQGK